MINKAKLHTFIACEKKIYFYILMAINKEKDTTEKNL